jgi:hypothetical protein
MTDRQDARTAVQRTAMTVNESKGVQRFSARAAR